VWIPSRATSEMPAEPAPAGDSAAGAPAKERRDCKSAGCAFPCGMWIIYNVTGAISSFWPVAGSVTNDWSKMGDRDVFGYINIMQSGVLGEWDVIHQEGHVEKRKKDKSTWTTDRGSRHCGSGYCSR
jgi:hypothetical protein